MAQELYTHGYGSLFNRMPTYIKRDLDVNNMRGEITQTMSQLCCVVVMNKQYKHLENFCRSGFSWGVGGVLGMLIKVYLLALGDRDTWLVFL